MHRTLARFAEAEPALLLVLCTNLSWRRSFLSALLYTVVERERGKFVDRGAAAALVILTFVSTKHFRILFTGGYSKYVFKNSSGTKIYCMAITILVPIYKVKKYV